MNMIKKMNRFKEVKRGLLILACVLSLFSCKDSGKTYSDWLEEEEDAIESFIKGKNISVTTSLPTGTSEWMDGQKRLFYKYETGDLSGLYYHQVELGTGREPETNWRAYVRYKGYTLDGTLIYDCTSAVSPDPLSFTLVQKPSTGYSYGMAFQNAVRNLRVGGHCQIIIPFGLANGSLTTVKGGKRSDAEEHRPMYYDIWLVGLE